MDKTSKLILNTLIDKGGCEYAIYFGDEFDDLAVSLKISTENLRANVRYLHDLGYIDYQKYSNSNKNAAFALSHKGLHWKYFRKQEILKYLGERWIEFFALLASIFSLVISIIAIMSGS